MKSNTDIIDGVNRRRGQTRSQNKVVALKIFFRLLGGVTILLLLFVVTWIVTITGSISSTTTTQQTKTTNDVAPDTTSIITAAEAPNSLRANVASRQEEEKEPAAAVVVVNDSSQTSPPPPGGTSLVQCTISTPNTNNNDTAAAAAANGVITITVRHDLSPIASQIFVDLIVAKWFDGCYFFRVLKGFIAQSGIRHAELKTKNNNDIRLKHPIPKDKKGDVITESSLSNIRGTVSFAGGNPSGKQLFINLGDNRRLDKEGGGSSRPFATVDETSMVTVIDKIYDGYKDGSGQVPALAKGVEAINEKFPHWSKIDRCEVLVVAAEYKE